MIYLISRDTQYAPNSEARDEAIFKAVALALTLQGEPLAAIDENRLPSAFTDADLVLSMARSRSAQTTLAAAESAGTAVVGLIPFNPNAPAHLFVPERLQIDDIPVPEHEVTLAEPTQIEGRENPGYRQAVATAVVRMQAPPLN